MNNFIYIAKGLLSNLCPFPEVSGFYGLSYITYLFVYVCIVFVLLAYLLLKLPKAYKEGVKIDTKRIILWLKNCYVPVFLFFVCLITLIQTNAHFKHFLGLHYKFSLLSYDSKKEILNPKVHALAKGCHDALKEKHLTGKLITDLDLSCDPGMFLHRRLKYELFPSIDLKTPDPAGQPDCLIYFQKDNAEKLVPSDFEIIYKVDDKHLLAVRRDHA